MTTNLSPSTLDLLSTIGTVGVIAALLALVVLLLERTNRRASGPGRGPLGADQSGDRDLVRTLDELRAARAGARGSVSRRHHHRPRAL